MKSKQFAKPEGTGGKFVTYMMNLMNQSLYRSVYHSIPKQSNISVLDIGYGNGFLLRKLLKKGHSAVYGLEISETMYSLVSTKLKSYINNGSCQLAIGGVESMPFANQTFDTVYTINTTYFWKSLDTGLEEIKRVLKKDGQCIIAYYDERFLRLLPYTKNGFQIYSNEDIEQALSRNGFIIKKRIYKEFHMAISYVCEIVEE